MLPIEPLHYEKRVELSDESDQYRYRYFAASYHLAAEFLGIQRALWQQD